MRHLIILLSFFTFSCSQGVKIPIQENNYVHIYQPMGDIFQGPSTKHLKEGEYIDIWRPNDHTIVKGNDGYWHMFGITHPIPPIDEIVLHHGGFQSTHVVSKTKDFKRSFVEGGWVDKPKVLTRHDTNHSPNIAEKDGVYYMLYGNVKSMHIATSTDLYNWEIQEEPFKETLEGARDPHILRLGDTFYVSYCIRDGVAMRTTKDFKEWSEPKIIFAPDYDPESPSIIHYDGKFYLFVCVWHVNKERVIKDVNEAYTHETRVYVADNIDHIYTEANYITTLNAHAPEIFQDEDGDWYISSVQYPVRGVSVDRLYWE